MQTKTKVEELFTDKLKVEVGITRAHRVGRYTQERGRLIVLKLDKESDKDKIMDAKVSLKGTRIYIEDDFSVRVRNQRRILLEMAK